MSTNGEIGLDPEQRDVLHAVGKSWGWVLFFGIVTLILGIVVVIEPRNTVYAFAVVVGIWLFVAGLFRIVEAIAASHESGGDRWLMVLLGLFSVFIGILFLRRTEETVTTLAFLLGLFWVIGGIAEFFHAYIDVGGPARGWRLATGVLAFLAGIAALVVPNLTLDTLAVIIGVWLIVYGVLEIALSTQVKKLAGV